MDDIWSHARNLTPMLSKSLIKLETGLSSGSFSEETAGSISESRLQEAIAATWQLVINDAAQSSVAITAEYLAHLHRKLASAAGSEAPGTFLDGESPQSWSIFVDEVTPLLRMVITKSRTSCHS